MNKKKGFFIATAIAIPVAVFFMVDAESPIAHVEEIEQEKASVANSSSNPSKFLSITEQPLSYLSCKQFATDHQKVRRKWEESIKNNVNKYLEKGYSSRDIVYAIHHFRNFNFAKDWLFEYMTRDSRLLKENMALSRKATSKLIDQLTASERVMEKLSLPERDELEKMKNNTAAFIQVKKKHPIANLVGYEKMNSEERSAAIAIEAPTVDDIAAYIRSKLLTEGELIDLLEHVEDPSEMVVSLGSRSPVYLMELSISYWLYGVADYLLDSGVKPEQGVYLKNSLEWALINLETGIRNNNELDSSISMIKKLSSHNMTARHHVADSGDIESWKETVFYEFQNDWVIKLQQEYGLDLISIARPIELRESYFNSSLLSKLEEEKQAFLSEEYGEIDYQSNNKNCKELNQKIASAWTGPNMFSEEVRALQAKYAEDSLSVENELAIKDPDYIDCFRDRLQKRQHFQLEQGEFVKAYYPQRRGSQFSINSFIEEYNPTQDELDWLFYTAFYLNYTKDLTELLDSGFLLADLDYSRLNIRNIKSEVIKDLSSNGIDLMTYDGSGKNMLYYAVKENQLELVKYMVEKGYPVDVHNGSQDPLHILLASWKRQFSEDKMLQMLPDVMSTNPTIDQFHLARVKLLQLRDIGLYKKVISLYPSLTPNMKTKYPDAACS